MASIVGDQAHRRGIDLLDAWVRILNDGDVEAIAATFAPGFRDHHPPLNVRDRGIDGVVSLVRTLHQEHNDMHFTVEDAFGDRRRLAYRLFGEGVLQVGYVGLDMRRPRLVHYQVTSVGIFEVRGDRLVQRWGPVLVTEASNHTQSPLGP